MALDVGSRLGYDEVAALIGEGGTGEVCRARDTKPDRDVALIGHVRLAHKTHAPRAR